MICFFYFFVSYCGGNVYQAGFFFALILKKRYHVDKLVSFCQMCRSVIVSWR